MPTLADRMRSLAATGAVLLSSAFYLWWEVVHRGVFAYNQSIYGVADADEWRYTACSRLVEHGYALFSQVFSAQPPLLFLSLAGGLRLVQDSILGARWTEIAFGLLGLLCAVWVSWLIAGPWAGAATAALLAVSPGFLLYSHTVEAEGPMMALVTLSLALALLSRRTDSSALSILCGLALAAAVLMKLFALWVLPAALWAILAGRPSVERRRVLLAVLLVAAAALPVALDFVLVQPKQQWAQVVQLHERAASLHLSNTTPPLALLGQFLAIDLGLSMLAAAGILALIVLRRWRDAIFFLLWLPAGLLMLYLFRPLFQHHPAILLTALSCAAGVGIAAALDALPRSLPGRSRLEGPVAAPGPGASGTIRRCAERLRWWRREGWGAGRHSRGRADRHSRGRADRHSGGRAGRHSGRPLRGRPRPGRPRRADATDSMPLRHALQRWAGALSQAWERRASADRPYPGPPGSTTMAAASGPGSSRERRWFAAVLPVLLGLAAYVLFLPRLAHADRHFLVAGQSRPVAALAAYVRAHSSASDFVAADDLAVADEAHRLVPPPLCDPSNVRLRAGYLTAADLIGATRRYHARLVLPSFGIYQQVSGYMAWLRGHYRPRPAPGGFTAYVPR